jgi:hypothetical protein
MSDQKSQSEEERALRSALGKAAVAGIIAMGKTRRKPPPIIYDEKVIGDALKILTPKPEWREECLEDIKTAFNNIEHPSLFPTRSKPANKALAQLLAALKRAQTAKAKLPWLEASSFETACDLEAGIAFCDREEVERKQAAPRKPRPPSHKQREAVATAYYLVNHWLVRRRGIYDADALSRQSPWYKLSAVLFGKKVNLLAHMSDYKKGMDRTHAAIFDTDANKRPRRKPGAK